MKAYQTFKFEENPDVGDIREDGRASHVGRLSGRSGDFRSYCRSANKKAIRRHLKRADRARFNRLDREER